MTPEEQRRRNREYQAKHRGSTRSYITEIESLKERIRQLEQRTGANVPTIEERALFAVQEYQANAWKIENPKMMQHFIEKALRQLLEDRETERTPGQEEP